MKSLEELMAIKQKMQDKVAVRNAENDNVRVVVGMRPAASRRARAPF